MNMVQANEFLDRDGGRVTWRVMEVAAAISEGLSAEVISGMISDRKAARKKYDIDERVHIEVLMKRYGFGAGAKKTAFVGVLSKAFIVVGLTAGLSAHGTQGETHIELMECRRKLAEEMKRADKLSHELYDAKIHIECFDGDLISEVRRLTEAVEEAEYRLKVERSEKLEVIGRFNKLDAAHQLMFVELAIAKKGAEKFREMKKLMGSM